MAAVLLVRVPASPGDAGPLGDPALRSAVDDANRLLAHPSGDLEEGIDRLLGTTLDVEALVGRTFGNYIARTLEDYDRVMAPEQLARYTASHQRQLVIAVRRRLVRDLADRVRGGAVATVALPAGAPAAGESTVDLLATGPGGPSRLRLHMRRVESGWRIADVEYDGQLLSHTYRERYSRIIDSLYSLSVLVSRLEERDYISLEDFAAARVGSFPEGWGWRPKDDGKPRPYEVREAGGRPYLSARDEGASVILLKYAHWDPVEYPIMTWCWRADELPPGGDERYNRTNDSAAGWYVIFSQNWLGVPRQIKYVWSTTLEVGTVDRRNQWARPYFFVVESGSERLGRWTFEQVDLVADYGRVFDGKPRERTLGIGLLTDANSTGSRAAASYADLRVWKREALRDGQIDDYCSCLEDDK
ncbi:MAG: DUF3047 domain-containing protein [Gemmatimonadota bacterium]